MRALKSIHIISAHAEGEVGDVIVGGVLPPPGDTIWEQSRYIATDQKLRNFVLNEPRGGVFRHVNLLVPPKHPDADAGFIIMEPEDTPPMSGSNSICVATVLLDSGILQMKEPKTALTLEAPGGLIRMWADCFEGKAQRINLQNLPSFAQNLDVNLEVDGVGTLRVDTAFGGDSFVIVDASSLDLAINADEASDIAKLGMKITASANEQIGFDHPLFTEWKHVSFCLFAGPLLPTKQGFETKSAVAIRPGKVDRSPTGTAISARMALLHAQGKMVKGQTLVAKSIIGSSFTGEISQTVSLNGTPAIIPVISGRAWISGTYQLLLDPDDPWPEGYRLSDTWGVRSEYSDL